MTTPPTEPIASGPSAPEPPATPAVTEPTALPTAPVNPPVAPPAPVYPPVAPPAPAFAQHPHGLGSAWGRATATRGGRVATVVVLALSTLAVVFLVAGAVFAIGGRDRGAGAFPRGGSGWQEQNGNGWGYGHANPGSQGYGRTGRGSLGDGALGFGTGRILHGTFTEGSGGTPTEYLLQRGQVTASSSGSITVASRDGYTSTYTITAQTRANVSRPPTVGSEVFVLATKADSKVVVLRVTSPA